MNNPSDTADQSRRVHTSVSWLTTLAWAGLIFYLSTGTYAGTFTIWLLSQLLGFLRLDVSPNTFATLHFLLRKLGHLTEYAILSLLVYGSLGATDRLEWRPRTALWCVFAAGGYAITDEFHQSFVPGRDASLIDCGIDTVGAALGMLGVYGGDRFFQAKSSNTAANNASPPAKEKGVEGE